MNSVVVVPTYNEAENIGPFLARMRAVQPTLDVLFVDDDSPDGTATVIARHQADDRHVDLLIRTGSRGYGAACREGFRRALERGSGVVVTMDCDLSHDPTEIENLVAEIHDGADLVVGSRYVPGGRTENWSRYRRALSRWGNRYTAWLLRLDIADCTSGFRAYTADCLGLVVESPSAAEGYAFLTETLRTVAASGGRRVAEHPIVFVDRTRGRSKMSLRIVFESARLVTRWGVSDRRVQRRRTS